jgi:hypothetical protein
LDSADSKTVIVAMEGISNILKCGKKDFPTSDLDNSFAIELETCGGVDKIEQL